MNTIETDLQETIVCPWCAHRYTEPWEALDKDEGRLDCRACDKPFEVERVIDVTYTTWKPRGGDRA